MLTGTQITIEGITKIQILQKKLQIMVEEIVRIGTVLTRSGTTAPQPKKQPLKITKVIGEDVKAQPSIPPEQSSSTPLKGGT